LSTTVNGCEGHSLRIGFTDAGSVSSNGDYPTNVVRENIRKKVIYGIGNG
jgi:hypothetical protein